MEARKMFKELGLDYVSIDFDNEDTTIKITYYDNKEIEIDMYEDKIRYYEKGTIQPYLNTKYLKAIIQQYKELGWLDE